ncbi:MAG: hypothetical protein K6F00_11170 [Lachnospiraceae bacterium]|nr:hypothetical protein [Lachnospiraceae bacterium]
MDIVRKIEEVKPFYNFLMGWQEGVPKEWYCGIEGISFIWHGEWADPELGYKGYAINEPSAVDGLYDEYYEETRKDDFNAFISWLKVNKHLLIETLDCLIYDYNAKKGDK